jgi:glucosamine--fructose-6-phosphate aminotransferase (isomerizing)
MPALQLYNPKNHLLEIAPKEFKIALQPDTTHQVIPLSHSPISPSLKPLPQVDFPHLMLKEIYEQPEVLQRCLSNYLPLPAQIENFLTCPPTQIQILASGTSRHAGLVAQYWFEQICGIATRVRSASEFLAAPLPVAPHTLTLAITQSGETADTLAATRLQQERLFPFKESCPVLGITNQSQSSLADVVDEVLPTLAGGERSVAATKTFSAQLAVLLCLVIHLAQQQKSLDAQHLHQITVEMRSLPRLIQTTLQPHDQSIQKMAASLVSSKNCIVLGQGVNRVIALEGALKLKETTYIHAEGYAAGEFLHGPLALVDETTPVIAIALPDSAQSQVITIVQRIRSHGAPVIGITSSTSPVELTQMCDQLITLPTVNPFLSPFMTALPLQLLAYHTAVQKGLDVDKPRYITKTIV